MILSGSLRAPPPRLTVASIFLYTHEFREFGVKYDGPEGPGPLRGPGDRFYGTSRSITTTKSRRTTMTLIRTVPARFVCILHHLLPEWLRVPGNGSCGDPNFPFRYFLYTLAEVKKPTITVSLTCLPSAPCVRDAKDYYRSRR